MSHVTMQITDEAIENAIQLARIERSKAFLSAFKSIGRLFAKVSAQPLPNNTDARTV